MKPILECKGLSKKYNNMNYALTNLNLALAPGQIVGLLGPNGSGKSTLIKLINDLLIPTEGEVLVDGMTPGVETKKIVSYLPERTYLDPAMKIRDIISYFADFYENFVTDRVYHMMTDLEIDVNARMRTLSKGTKEKVQLALVMSRDARLYILDEPTTGLHFADVHKLVDILHKLAEGGGPYLRTTAKTQPSFCPPTSSQTLRTSWTECSFSARARSS